MSPTAALGRFPSARHRDEHGASAVEYGLLVAAIAALIAVVAFGLGGVIREAFFEDTCEVVRNGAPDISSTCG